MAVCELIKLDDCCEACDSAISILSCSYQVRTAADCIFEIEIEPKWCPSCGRKIKEG